MPGKVSLAIILVPYRKSGLVTNRAHIDITISVNISKIGGMGGIDCIINHMLFPAWPLEPKDAHSVTHSGENIHDPIPIDIGRGGMGGS